MLQPCLIARGSTAASATQPGVHVWHWCLSLTITHLVESLVLQQRLDGQYQWSCLGDLRQVSSDQVDGIQSIGSTHADVGANSGGPGAGADVAFDDGDLGLDDRGASMHGPALAQVRQKLREATGEDGALRERGSAIMGLNRKSHASMVFKSSR